MTRPGPLVLGLLGAAFYLFIQFQGEYLYDGDAYFHIKIAALFLEGGPPWSLPWMAHAIHAERYVNFHFLYHVLLTPFVFVFDLITAAKVSAALFAGFSVGCFALLIGRVVPRERLWFWVLLLLCASPVFTGRLMFGRTTTLFLGMVFLFLYFLETKRIRWAAVLCALAVWTYPGFPLLLVAAGVLFVSTGLREGKWPWPVVLYPGCAALAAFVLHPAFPHHFHGYYLEWVVHTLGPAELEAIGEWQPAPLEIGLLAVALPGLLALGGVLRRAPWTTFDVSLGCFTICLVVSGLRSIKALEYLVPMLLVLAAIRWHRPPDLGERTRDLLGAGVLLVVLVLALPDLYRRTGQQEALMRPHAAFAVADWLGSRNRDGEIVLVAWDVFPFFFFRNDRVRYSFGLNPVYAYGADPRRYVLLRRLFESGQVEPERIVRDLGSRVVVLRRGVNARAIARFDASASARRVFFNDWFVVFEIAPPAGSSDSPTTPAPAGTSSPSADAKADFRT